MLSVDGAFRKILGWEPSEIVGRRIGELVHRDDLQQGLSSWAKLLKTPGATGEGLRLRYQHRDGRWVWLDVVNRNRLPEDIESEMVDVTAEVAALDELRIRDQLLAQLTDSVPVGLFHVDTEGRLLYVNPQLAEMTSVAGAKTLGEQLTGLADTDRPRLRAAVQGATAGAETGAELGVTTPAGERRRWSVGLWPVREPNGTIGGITGCVQDVTDSPQAPRGKDTTDPLTGCITREAALTALEGLIARHGLTPLTGAGRRGGGGRGTAVLVIDIDGFQAINERFGRQAGDEMLTLVALRIIDSVRTSDIIGRVGADEFAVLCSGVPGPTTALTIGRSTLEQVCQPMELKGVGSIPLRASMGVSWTNRTEMPAAQLLRQADEAKTASKLAASTEPVLAQSGAR